MSKKDPVKKNMDILHKPKTHRDRKKNPSKEDQRRELEQRMNELHHPLHQPYERNKDWKRDLAASMEDDDVVEED